MRRPVGVVVLAACHFLVSFVFLCLVAAVLAPPRWTADLFVWLGTDGYPADSAIGIRLIVATVIFGVGILEYLFARGLWRLRNWARIVFIALIFLNLSGLGTDGPFDPLTSLFSEKVAPFLFPHYWFVESGFLRAVLGVLSGLVILIYLFRPTIKAAFHARPSEWKWVSAIASVTLLIIGHGLYRSGSELRAIKWHAHHGEQVTVGGVVFPIYYWYVPKIEPDGSGFKIEDSDPGPFRHDKDESPGYFEVLGKRRCNDVPASQLADEKFAELQREGHKNLARFSSRVGDESIACVDASDFSFARASYCFGDGPVYSTRFYGPDGVLYKRFKTMLADAKPEKELSNR